MSRTQFTFTFTDAQPGSDVHFSAPVFADADTSVPDGPTLVLDSDNSVSVFADAGFLIATTVDGNGQAISATATATSPSVSTDEGTAGQNPFSSGTSGAVAPTATLAATVDALTLDNNANYVTYSGLTDAVDFAAFAEGWASITGASDERITLLSGVYAISVRASVSGLDPDEYLSVNVTTPGNVLLPPQNPVIVAQHPSGDFAANWWAQWVDVIPAAWVDGYFRLQLTASGVTPPSAMSAAVQIVRLMDAT